MQIKTKWEDVTPQKAKTWLGTLYEGQRNIKKQIVKKFADDMKSGKWLRTGDTIKFDQNGKLIDGQHRLHAIVDSNRTQRILVVRGLPTKAYQHIDIGIKRTDADMFKFSGIKNSALVSAACRWCMSYETGGITPGNRHIGNGMGSSTEFVLEYYYNHDLIQEFAKSAMRLKTIIAPSAALFLIYKTYISNSEKHQAFWDAASGIVSPTVRHPAYHAISMLAEATMKSHIAAKRLRTEERAYALAKAWNYHKVGKSLSSQAPLRWSGKGSIPEFPKL